MAEDASLSSAFPEDFNSGFQSWINFCGTLVPSLICLNQISFFRVRSRMSAFNRRQVCHEDWTVCAISCACCFILVSSASFRAWRWALALFILIRIRSASAAMERIFAKRSQSELLHLSTMALICEPFNFIGRTVLAGLVGDGLCVVNLRSTLTCDVFDDGFFSWSKTHLRRFRRQLDYLF